MSENYVVTGPCKITCILFGLLAAAIAAYLLGGATGPIVAGLLAILTFIIASWLLHKVFCGHSEVSTSMAVGTAAAATATAVSASSLVSSGTTSAAPAAEAKPAKTSTKGSNTRSTSKKAAPKKAAGSKKTSASKPATKKTPAKKSGPQRLKKPKGKADDLKRISGVGPKLEKTLNGLGFWHFSQIAEWKKADVAIVDDELSFKGRIERDDWIKQAKALAKKK